MTRMLPGNTYAKQNTFGPQVMIVRETNFFLSSLLQGSLPMTSFVLIKSLQAHFLMACVKCSKGEVILHLFELFNPQQTVNSTRAETMSVFKQQMFGDTVSMVKISFSHINTFCSALVFTASAIVSWIFLIILRTCQWIYEYFLYYSTPQLNASLNSNTFTITLEAQIMQSLTFLVVSFSGIALSL